MRGLPSPVNGVRSDRCVDTTLRCCSLTGIPHLLGVRGFKSHLPHLHIFFLPNTLLLLNDRLTSFTQFIIAVFLVPVPIPSFHFCSLVVLLYYSSQLKYLEYIASVMVEKYYLWSWFFDNTFLK